MTQYISKSALVAEIEKIIPQRAYERETLHSEFVRGQRVAYNKVLSFIETFAVKEVDLESEIENVRKSHFINSDFDKATLDGRNITNIAKHFFELGLKAQKGESV